MQQHGCSDVRPRQYFQQVRKCSSRCRFKEQALSRELVQACNLDLNANVNAKKALNWRRGNSSKSAGNFPAAMEEVSI